jgi:hypothetical protein
MISKAIKTKLAQRDPYCLHCGEINDLVIHHRKNRGMGGSKLLDNMSNLLRICNEYNVAMESVSVRADAARELGHKLRQWDDTSAPVKDECDGMWYILDDVGNKTLTEEPQSLF